MTHHKKHTSPLISLLFVPADRPERFVKAMQAGASAIIIDLEDTIKDNDKPKARQHVIDFDCTLQDQDSFWVRINNDPTKRQYQADLDTLAQCHHLAGVVLPKVASADDIQLLHQVLPLPIIAVIETPKPLLNLANIAQATGLHALSFGILDLGNHLGIIQGSDGANIVFNRIRTDLVQVSAAFGLAPPIETIFSQFKDHAGLLTRAKTARGMGFGGQMCIHPQQVPFVNTAYAATDDVGTFAKKVLAEHGRTGSIAFAIDGVMVDLPVIEWAKNVLNV